MCVMPGKGKGKSLQEHHRAGQQGTAALDMQMVVQDKAGQQGRAEHRGKAGQGRQRVHQQGRQRQGEEQPSQWL